MTPESMYRCDKCQVDVFQISEYYMLYNHLWDKIMLLQRRYVHMLCIGCVEEILGRKLNRFDFTPCNLNLLEDKTTSRSERLIDRLGEQDEYFRTVAKQSAIEIENNYKLKLALEKR